MNIASSVEFVSGFGRGLKEIPNISSADVAKCVYFSTRLSFTKFGN